VQDPNRMFHVVQLTSTDFAAGMKKPLKNTIFHISTHISQRESLKIWAVDVVWEDCIPFKVRSKEWEDQEKQSRE